MEDDGLVDVIHPVGGHDQQAAEIVQHAQEDADKLADDTQGNRLSSARTNSLIGLLPLTRFLRVILPTGGSQTTQITKM